MIAVRLGLVKPSATQHHPFCNQAVSAVVDILTLSTHWYYVGFHYVLPNLLA
ncbi:hypothetical protein [Stanieria cyanosphaera]|uniref:hypothetical protein n=1 Tax=Stanieria cyanosphaera TaxID=102116 RepID=UPI0002EE8BBF|nr:hypothetical protein [Stanieria cyanosphaera]